MGLDLSSFFFTGSPNVLLSGISIFCIVLGLGTIIVIFLDLNTSFTKVYIKKVNLK